MPFQKIHSDALASQQQRELPTQVEPLKNENQAIAHVSALGLDVGRKRTGVAGCDRTGLIATGLCTLEQQSFQGILEQIRALVQQRQVEVLVVGLPYTMQGEEGAQAKQVRRFAQRLSKALGLPVEYVDERLTSFEAEQLLRQERPSPNRDKGLIDRKAAAIILQQWLDDRRKRLAMPSSETNLDAAN